MNDDLDTEYYLLIWPKANTTDLSKIIKDSFIELDCVLIKKRELRDYLATEGYSKSELKNKARTIKNSSQYEIIDKTKYKPYYFYRSRHNNYSEEPINIIIRKDKLMN